MKEKIFSFLKKRFELPSAQESVKIFRIFRLWEKIIFCFLFLVFITSFLMILRDIGNKTLANVPEHGGALTEGLIGTPRFINPLLPISDTDRDMVSLIYSGLMRADNNGQLAPDMAEKYEISDDGLSYTFYLRKDLKWHDGEKITSDDIIFTIMLAKDDRLKSPKRAGWEGVQIEKINDETLRFVLDKPYAPFLENTTIGILPMHIWKDITPDQITFSEFNIDPIGSGPYKIDDLKRNSSGIISSYTLKSNKKFALGKPYISKITIKFYPSEEKLLAAYNSGDIDSISAIPPQIAQKNKKNSSQLKTPLLPRIFGVFFNHNEAKIFAQNEVRSALNLAVDKEKIIDEIFYGYAEMLNYPIPPDTFGSIKEKSENPFNPEKAKSILKENGWKENAKTGILEKKKGKETMELKFSLATSDTPELKQTAELLKSMWENIGIKVDLKIFEIGDLNQNIIRPRKYEALLFGEIIGRDPDPFAFWHSSQRNDPGLNIAMYTNITVDKLIEEARILSSKEKRERKYIEFQKEIKKDNPAIFLYSPQFIYIIPNSLKIPGGIKNINTPSERFSQIHKWYIKTRKTLKVFEK